MVPRDPYRLLFDRLKAGAAHCRWVVDNGKVASVVVVDHNPAFAPFAVAVPQLLDALSHSSSDRLPESLRLHANGCVLSVAIYPTGSDEAIVVIEDVTARDELEEQLRASQNRFQQAFHGNGAAMVIAHQSDLRILDVNPRWLELFAAKREEVIGRTSVELGLIAESLARARIAQHHHSPAGFATELPLRSLTGDNLTVLASAKPIEIAEGRCTLTTLIDITARKQAEEAFAVAFSASPSGMMLVHDASNTIIAVNNRLLEMTRHERAELIGRRADELVVLAPARDKLLAEIARSGLNGVEIELGCKDGSGIWTLASTEMVTLYGTPHRLSVFTDIAGRKRYEHRLLTQHEIGRILAEPLELEAALPPVLEGLCRGEGWDGGALWLLDPAGALQCRGAWRAPGVPRDLLDRVLRAGEAELVDSAAGRVVAFPIMRGAEVLGVVAMAARCGGSLLDAGERALYDSISRLLGLFVERARAEAALRQLNADLERRVQERTAELENSNRDLEQFASLVSHDLRAPLRTIRSFSSIVLEDFAAELPPEARRLLTSIDTSGGRLQQLIEDLLVFSRLGRQEVRRGKVDLDALVRSVVDELVAGRDLGERLDLRLGPLGTCNADRSLVRAVWTNLIDNALKYSRDRARIVIEIGCELRDGEPAYYVRDNGVGFDMAYADRLFGVFQRLHSTSEFEGTGVGLANVRRIVERHHGKVTATAQLGHGATFEFTLGVLPSSRL